MLRFITLLLTAGLLSCEAKMFYVTPTLPADQTCPPPCHTLDQYAQNISLFVGHTKISLIFMKGVHNLSHNFEIRRFTSNNTVEFRGLEALPEDTIINLLSSTNLWVFATDIHLYNIRMDSDLIINQHLNLRLLAFHGSNINIQNCSINTILLYERDVVTLHNTEIRGLINFFDANEVVIQSSVFTGVFSAIRVQSLSISGCKFIGFQNGALGELTRVGATQIDKVSIQNTTVSDAKTFGLGFTSVNNVTITDSNIVNNTFGMQSVSSNLSIRDTEITGNVLGVVVISRRFESSRFYTNNCTFSFNTDGGLVLLNTQPIITDSSFHSNQGTPITAYQSTFELRGETIFRDNTVRSGGGLALINSTVIFGPESNTMFINNTAEEFGGAIYTVNLPLKQFTELFILNQNNINIRLRILGVRYGSFRNLAPTNVLLYVQDQRCFYLLEKGSFISFAGNKASLGGYDIFGPETHAGECSLLNNPSFRFSNEISNTYKISSDPMRVCFCTNNVPQCENRRYLVLNETRYPGESFTTSVVLAGYNYGRVAGSVYTNVLGGDHKQVISKNQHLQAVNLVGCNNLTYTVSSSDSVVLVLTTQEQRTQEQNKDEIGRSVRNIYSKSCSEEIPCTALLTTPLFVNVTLETCPLGFELDKTNKMCECDINLANFRDNDQVMITCVIRNRTGYITREGAVWVGVDTSENNTDSYYWHRYCPRDHCNSSQTAIDLRSPDVQCSSNRAGVLCGRCQINHSLQLGGNKCLKCNNNYLVLVIAFAVLGVLLVTLIKLLDLTVTSGTINGLLFYANVVWRNNAILLPLQDRQSIGYYIITVPIAWINLDFGIETCFSENLDQLTKTGLQFVFPVYIWCIAGLIIVISHYSTRATKLCGNNSVSVLATLFLLSYGKLFRNITDVFTFADIPNSNGTTHKVWSLDGNVRYGGTPGHIVLIVVALLFLILFLLPFTLTLLLVPFLRTKSHLRPFHWVNTMKPFFDTIYGPFKDKKQHEVWTGILLVSRVVILIVFTSTSTHNPNANILLMTLVSMLLFMYSASVGLLYKKWYLSSLENLYILNLTMLGGTFLFYEQTSENPRHNELNPVTTTSVIVALLLFILTVMIFTAKRGIFTEKVQTCFKKNEKKDFDFEEIARVPEAREDGMGPTVQIVSIRNYNEYDFTQFREPVLEMSH